MAEGSMFIKKELVLTVQGNTAKLDQPLYLFQNDKFIDIYFTIVNFKFDFIRGIQTEENIVVSSNASYATVRVLKPNGQKVISNGLLPLTDDENRVLFTINETFMDAVDEIGIYKLQISLWDSNEGSQQGKVTLPYIEFEVLEPIFPEDYVANYVTGQVDITRIGMSRIANPDEVQAELQSRMNTVIRVMEASENNGETVLYDWNWGDIITSSRMNAIHNNIHNINNQLDNLNALNIPFDNEEYPTIASALNKLLQVSLEATFYTDTHDLINEIGSTIRNLVVTWEYNKNIYSQQINDIQLSDNTIRHYTFSSPITKDTTITLMATDRETNIVKSLTFTFVNRIYYGTSSSNNTNDIIADLSSKLQDKKNITFDTNTQQNEYIYYASPIRLGVPTFTVGGFVGGFTVIDVVSITNKSNYTESYYIYRSDNPNLGATTVVVT